MERIRRPARRIASPTVEIRASLPCEFIVHLSESSMPAVHGSMTLGKEWFSATRANAEPDLLVAIDALSDSSPNPRAQLWFQLLAIAYETPAPHDVPTFLTHFAEVPPLQVRLALLGYHDLPQHRVAPQETLLLAAQGDQAALEEVAERQFPSDAARRDALIDLLAGEPDETRSRLLETMRRWYEAVFRDQEAEILPILERDARATRELSRTLPLEKLVETLTNGIEFQPWPGLQWVALVPSYIARPWMIEKFQGEGTIICYPVADESLVEGAEGPPARIVRLHQALGDERRLRILRHLASRRAAFQEIANALDLPKSSLHYHLGILRGAGLLLISVGDHGIVYGLRRDALTGMADEMLRYLEGDEDEPPA